MLIHKCDICKKELTVGLNLYGFVDTDAKQEEIDRVSEIIGPNGVKEICLDCYDKTLGSLADKAEGFDILIGDSE